MSCFTFSLQVHFWGFRGKLIYLWGQKNVCLFQVQYTFHIFHGSGYTWLSCHLFQVTTSNVSDVIAHPHQDCILGKDRDCLLRREFLIKIELLRAILKKSHWPITPQDSKEKTKKTFKNVIPHLCLEQKYHLIWLHEQIQSSSTLKHDIIRWPFCSLVKKSIHFCSGRPTTSAPKKS